MAVAYPGSNPTQEWGNSVTDALNAGNVIAAKATRSTTGPTIAANTWTLVVFPTSVYDATSMINTSTGIVTIPVAAKYRITFSLPWSSYGSSHDRKLAIFKGVTATGTPLACVAKHSGADRWWAQVTAEDMFAAGDQITCWIWSDTTSSGGNPTETNAPLTSLTISAP